MSDQPEFHTVPSEAVPDFLAVVVSPEQRVLYCGPVQWIPSDFPYPHGSYLNVSPTVFARTRDALAKTGEGIPWRK